LSLFLLLVTAVSGWAQSAPAAYRLTLEDAIQRGLQANLGVLVAETRTQEAAATSERRQSLLLPRVTLDAPVAEQNRSLAAMGISVPGLPLPQVTAPFSTYEVRAYADQPIVDMQLLHGLRSARWSSAAAKSDYQDARDQVIRNVAALYLSAQSQFALAVAAQSRVETADALYKLAAEQRDAGVATGIDVLRAQVQLANERQSLVQARNRAQGSLLVLARNIGMSPGTGLELADPLEYHATNPISVETALPQALTARPDYQSLLRQHDALVEQLRASRARLLPKFTASGNYGGIGQTIDSLRATGVAQLALSITVFDRDRNGEASEIEARMRRVAGFDVVRDAERVKQQISYMSQRFGLYEDLTVDENIRFYAAVFGVKRALYRERSEHLLHAADMQPFRTRLAGKLSGGMKQKLGLICALIHTPRVLLLDEPTNGVDPVSRRDFWKILYSLLEEGVAILTSTAYLDEAERCHRVALVHQGRLLFCERPEVLKRSLHNTVVAISTADARNVRAAIQSLPGIRNSVLVGDGVHLLVDDAARMIPVLGQRLDEAKLPYVSMTAVTATLEDVFVNAVERETGVRNGQ
jgi:ABC-2 type transport system ATP-binding protein